MREVGAPEGTCIEVADLVYNLPARRKFLKSDTAETTQISRLATQMALGYPEVGFTVTSGGRSLLQCPPVNSLRERFFQGGREVRIYVAEDKIDDRAAVGLSSEIAKKISAEMTFPGQIRVTVIRELRAIEIAN